jgi:hypothetical protein
MTDAEDAVNLREWKDLPPNVLIRVFSHLTLAELCTCGRVCWAWQGVAGMDRLWANLLQQQYGCSWYKRTANTSANAVPVSLCPSTPAQTVHNPQADFQAPHLLQSPRDKLLQHRTSKLWAAGRFKADITCVTSSGAVIIPEAPLGLSVTGTDLSELWSAQHPKAASSIQPTESGTTTTQAATASSVSPAAAAAQTCSLPPDFAACALAAGSNYLVLLSSDGRVVDTRGAFLQPEQPSPAQERAAAIRSLTWLLHIQDHVGHQVAHAAELEQHLEVVLVQLRQGTNISIRNPWSPPTAAAITSIASGEHRAF